MAPPARTRRRGPGSIHAGRQRHRPVRLSAGITAKEAPGDSQITASARVRPARWRKKWTWWESNPLHGAKDPLGTNPARSVGSLRKRYLVQ